MMGAVKNANGGNNYDLRRAEEEDMLDATRKLPRLLENKMNIINNMKRKEKEDEKRLLSQVRKKVNEEIKKQKLRTLSRRLKSGLPLSALPCNIPSHFSPIPRSSYVDKGAGQRVSLACLLCIPSPSFGKGILISLGESSTL